MTPTPWWHVPAAGTARASPGLELPGKVKLVFHASVGWLPCRLYHLTPPRQGTGIIPQPGFSETERTEHLLALLKALTGAEERAAALTVPHCAWKPRGVPTHFHHHCLVSPGKKKKHELEQTVLEGSFPSSTTNPANKL